jgi:hypothetical protein
MSPVIQRKRAQRPDPANGADQHWSMLLFESLSAGAMTVLVGFIVVLLAVGVYGLVVWPLTLWDLANVGIEKYGSWAQTALWSMFAGGSLAGYWCFSGAAFKTKTKSQPANSTTRGKSSRA